MDLTRRLLFSEIASTKLSKSKNELIIFVNLGKEAYVCELINNFFNPKKLALIPAYGSVVLIGNKGEITDICTIISASDNESEEESVYIALCSKYKQL